MSGFTFAEMVDIIRETEVETFKRIATELTKAPEHVTARAAGRSLLDGIDTLDAQLSAKFAEMLAQEESHA